MTATATSGLPFISGEALTEAVSHTQARTLIRDVLLTDFDVAHDPRRMAVDAGSGHLLLMPSTVGRWVGVKVASVAPDNPRRGLQRIQAIYVVMDAPTLTPRLFIDGTALTALRTPAVTAVAGDALAAPDAAHLVVFGTGPQAVEHVRALAAIRDLGSTRLIGRDPGRLDSALAALAESGIPAEAGAPEDVREADMVVCATSAKDPLFAGELVRDHAFVAAIGSHEPDRRELDGGLLARSHVFVEDVAAARESSGDVVLAAAEGLFDPAALRPLTDVVRGSLTRAVDRPTVFKGAGMSWQDLAIAAHVAEQTVGSRLG